MPYRDKSFIDLFDTRDQRFAITMGMVPGHSWIAKYGVNALVETTTDPEDIWETGGRYTWDASPAPLYVSSSSASDTTALMVQGLGSDGRTYSTSVTLQGQTKVLIPGSFYRVNRAYNDGATGLAGTVYIYRATTPTAGVPATAFIRATVSADANQTLMALYTIPLGKVGFWVDGSIGIRGTGSPSANADYAHLRMESKRYGKSFRVQNAIDLQIGSQIMFREDRAFPDPIPALTDLRFSAHSVTAALGFWGSFNILLVDEGVLSATYLVALGQPTSL